MGRLLDILLIVVAVCVCTLLITACATIGYRAVNALSNEFLGDKPKTQNITIVKQNKSDNIDYTNKCIKLLHIQQQMIATGLNHHSLDEQVKIECK